MNAMSGVTFVYLAIFAALLVAVLWRSPRGSLGMIAIAGVVGAGYGYAALGFYAVILPALVALVGGVQAGSGLMAGRTARFEAWAKDLQAGGKHAEVNEPVLESFYQNLYGPGFVYSADRAFVGGCQTPCLVLAGNDEAHPYPISEEIAGLLPKNEGFIKDWKSGQALVSAKVAVNAFWAKHTP